MRKKQKHMDMREHKRNARRGVEVLIGTSRRQRLPLPGFSIWWTSCSHVRFVRASPTLYTANNSHTLSPDSFCKFHTVKVIVRGRECIHTYCERSRFDQLIKDQISMTLFKKRYMFLLTRCHDSILV